MDVIRNTRCKSDKHIAQTMDGQGGIYRLLPFVIHLPISITVNKIPTVQVSCCGNLLILFIALANVIIGHIPI